MVRRYGPIVAVVVLIGGAVVVFGGGGDDGGDDGGSAAGGGSGEIPSEEELIRSGPMTVQKAELLGEDVDFGPRCDTERGTIMMPSTYAPPCIEPFDGDNGGATSPGVTADEIKLVYYNADPAIDPLAAATASQAGVDVDPEAEVATIQGYLDIYNEVFETYGRTVTLEVYTGTGANDDAEAALADAIAIAEKEPFAVIGGPAQASAVFAGELASQGIVCGPGCAFTLPEEIVEEFEPYLWQALQTPQQGVLAASVAIGSLAGPGPAELAGDPAMHDQDRVYGLVHYDNVNGDHQSVYEDFVDHLGEYGIEIAADVPYTLDLARVQENARTMISKLQDAGVTTVIYYGDPISPSALTTEATAQDYWPEWILGPNLLMDTTVFGRLTDGEQWKNGFGVSTSPAARCVGGHRVVRDLRLGVRRGAAPQRLPRLRPVHPHHVQRHPHGGARPDARDVPRRHVADAARRRRADRATRVPRRPRHLARGRLGRQRRRDPDLVGPDGDRRGRDRCRGRRHVPLRQRG